MQHKNKLNLPPMVYLVAMIALSVASISLTYPAIQLGIVWYSTDNPTTGVDVTLKNGEKLRGGSLQRTWDGLIFTDSRGAEYTAEAIETMVLPAFVEGSPSSITHPKFFLPPLILYAIFMSLWVLLFCRYRDTKGAAEAETPTFFHKAK
jgi:hypothetical protein